ncbi:MAG: hypothetical protein ACLRWQ_14490 [Flavonifractor plautii]
MTGRPWRAISAWTAAHCPTTIGALQREGVLTVRRDRFTLNF